MSGNFSADLYGPVDTRMAGQLCADTPCIWGNAEAVVFPITFKPPSGYSVRILSLRGDVVSWIKSLPGNSATPLESTAGVLAGFQLPQVEGSQHCDYCADGCPLYVQDAVTEKQPKARTPFSYDDVGEILGPDNKILVKLAAWLNTTGKPVHTEVTYTIRFRYEKGLPTGS